MQQSPDQIEDLTHDLQRVALAAARLGTFQWVLATDQVLLDERSRELFGFSVEEAVTAPEVFGRIHPDDLERVRKEAHSSIQNKTRLATEYRVCRPDGSERVLASYNGAVLGPDGHPECMVGVFSDISARRAAEKAAALSQQALRESEQRFRALVSATFTTVYRMNADWTAMRPLEGQGFTMDVPTPRKNWMEDLVMSEDRPHVQATIQKAAQDKIAFDLEHRIKRADGSEGWVHSRAVPLLNAAGEISEWIGAANDVTSRKADERRQNMLMAELDHRVKNILALVSSIARQSLARSGGESAEAAELFIGRLAALAQSHAMLAANRWDGASFGAIVENAFAPYRGQRAARVHTGGPDVQVSATATQTLTLALHEMVTNAVKHGALSSEEGRVDVEWTVVGDNPDQRLVFSWVEAGGPKIERVPERRSFGSRLIDQALRCELDGEVSLEFAQEGLRVAFQLPLRNLGTISRLPNETAPSALASSGGD